MKEDDRRIRSVIACRVDSWRVEGVDVSGLCVALSASTHRPDARWRAVIHVDERAKPAQHDVLLKLVTGQLGDGFGRLAGLIGEVRAIERRPIVLDVDDDRTRLSIGTIASTNRRAIVADGVRREYDADATAIEQTVLDYFEGWFRGDPARMERALHPQLVKRSLIKGAPEVDSLLTLTAREMIDATAQGHGRDEDTGELRIEIEIEDILGDLANVTVRSAVYVEYLHLARGADGWKIVNDVWQPALG